MGTRLSILLLDTHVLQWWSAEPHRLSSNAVAVLEDASELAVAAITWYELAWQAHQGCITVEQPISSWLNTLSSMVRTVALTPAIAAIAASLPRSFPGDPADRLIYATAIELGWQLVTKDDRMRKHRHSRSIVVW